jgi:hypothetical protein
MAAIKIDFLNMVEDIINLDPKMRFAAIIDSKGNIREAIMKSGKTSLKSQKEEEHFCKQVAQRKAMRKEFDKSLGKVRYYFVLYNGARDAHRHKNTPNNSHQKNFC